MSLLTLYLYLFLMSFHSYMIAFLLRYFFVFLLCLCYNQLNLRLLYLNVILFINNLASFVTMHFKNIDNDKINRNELKRTKKKMIKNLFSNFTK
jgi:uncharacterized membrane protein YedE/YeeE